MRGAGSMCASSSSRCENNCDIHDEHHGTGGETGRRQSAPREPPEPRPSWRPPHSCNIRATADFNGERQEGFGLFQVTQRDGRRFSFGAGLPRASVGAAEPGGPHWRTGPPGPLLPAAGPRAWR